MPEPEQSAKPEMRNRLLDAGRAVFAAVGYSGATVDDIIENASTSRASFYRYFTSKDDLFTALSHACFRDMKSVMADVGEIGMGVDGVEQLEEMLRRYRQIHARHAGVFRAWFERRSRVGTDLQAEASQAFGTLIESLVRAISSAAVPSSVSVEVQAALLYLLIDRSYFAVTSRWSEIDPDRVAPTLAIMIHRAYFGGVLAGHL
jgi:AcrR family transcriptional regulator